MRRHKNAIGWLLLLPLLLLQVAAPAHGHELRPAVATLSFPAPERFEIAFTLNAEALLAEIGPQHEDTEDAPQAALYRDLRELSPDQLAVRFRAFSDKWLAGIDLRAGDERAAPRLIAIEAPPVGDTTLSRKTRVTIGGEFPSGADRFRFQYAEPFGSIILRIKRGDQPITETAWLKNGALSQPFELARAQQVGALQRFGEYLVHGFEHIIPKGLDHILFVLGIYLLSPHWRALLWQVSAFTLAHTITLALGLYGIVQISPSIVEPLIALSIVYVAVENIFTTRLHSWRPLIVFGFGLLHGLGFAGVLKEVGLPEGDYLTALVGFNIGVEGGQLAVILVAWLLTGLWFSAKSWYRHAIVQPASLMIALTGAYWFVERVWS